MRIATDAHRACPQRPQWPSSAPRASGSSQSEPAIRMAAISERRRTGPGRPEPAAMPLIEHRQTRTASRANVSGVSCLRPEGPPNRAAKLRPLEPPRRVAPRGPGRAGDGEGHPRPRATPGRAPMPTGGAPSRPAPQLRSTPAPDRPLHPARHAASFGLPPTITAALSAASCSALQDGWA